MGYTSQAKERENVWKKITELGQTFMLHEPLKEIFFEIGIKEENDLWKEGKPSVAAII